VTLLKTHHMHIWNFHTAPPILLMNPEKKTLSRETLICSIPCPPQSQTWKKICAKVMTMLNSVLTGVPLWLSYWTHIIWRLQFSSYQSIFPLYLVNLFIYMPSHTFLPLFTIDLPWNLILQTNSALSILWTCLWLEKI
jgi:hypothetical protein